jgi:hypothetical protein
MKKMKAKSAKMTPLMMAKGMKSAKPTAKDMKKVKK